MYYAKLNQSSYHLQDTAKTPDHILSDMYLHDETAYPPGPSTVQATSEPILYERVSWNSAWTNALMYEPIQRDVDHTVPTYVIFKGSDQPYEFMLDLEFYGQYYDPSNNSAWWHSQTTAFNTEVMNLATFVNTYLTNNPQRQVVFVGHSLGAKFCLDVALKIYGPTFNRPQQIQSLRLFNAFVLPGSPSYDEAHKMAVDPAHSTLWKDNVFWYSIRGDFASALLLRDNVAFGRVTYYTNQDLAFQAANFAGIKTMREYVSLLSGGASDRAAFLNLTNHKMGCWTSLSVGESYLITERTPFLAGDEKAFFSLIKKPMSEYYRNDPTPKPLWLVRNILDSDPYGNYLDAPHEDNTHEFHDVDNFNWHITKNASRETYFKWIDPSDNKPYIAFAHDIVSKDDGETITRQFYFIQYNASYNILNGEATYYIGMPPETVAHEKEQLEMIRIPALSFNIDHYPLPTVQSKLYWRNMISTQDTNILQRSQWLFHMPLLEGMSPNQRRTNYVAPPAPVQPTEFELVLGLGPSSGLTNFNTYLISKGACYQNNNADSTERFVLLDTNGQYYAYPQIPATSGEGVQGYGAVAPDTEVWNISYDTANSVWNISNTNTSTDNRLYEDISNSGQGSSFLWELVSNGSSYSYSGLPSSEFPYENTSLTVINNGDGYYQMYVMYSGVKLYLFVQQNPFSNSHSYNYGFLTLIAETNIDSSKTNATKFKIANNVATGSNIY